MANGSQQQAGKRSSNFKQQRMKAWQPTPTACSTITTFTLIGVIFIILGSVLLVMSQNIVEISERYDKCVASSAIPTKSPTETPPECRIPFTLEEDMDKPVFLYYKLNNFYQNHRRYVKSRDYQQLSGDHRTVGDIESNCEPIVKVEDLDEIQRFGWGIEAEPSKDWALPTGAPANPCGLVAKSFMNDKYALEGSDTTTGYWLDDSDIAWESDVENKFDYLNGKQEDSKKSQWVDPTNAHFIVWMRTAGLPNFRKLYAKIDKDLKKDEKVTVVVQNKYDVEAFEGEKHLILSTTNAFGGRNDFLGIAYIVVGVISLIFAAFFGFKYSRSRKTS
mmetsp:Transcript_15539/g.17258  ORF Transcript_15539/g.17258 Transcript_15539/m.17258 type:complete len:333 (-) Transcript_15539:180-1178(-)